GGARPGRGGVLGGARMSTDFLRAGGMAEEVWIVGLLPHEDEVRSGHELGDERAPLGGTRKRVRLDAEPVAVVGAIVFCPQLLVGEQLLVEKPRPPRLEATLLHSEKLATRAVSTSGMLGIGSGGPARRRGRAGRVRVLARTPDPLSFSRRRALAARRATPPGVHAPVRTRPDSRRPRRRARRRMLRAPRARSRGGARCRRRSRRRLRPRRTASASASALWHRMLRAWRRSTPRSGG